MYLKIFKDQVLGHSPKSDADRKLVDGLSPGSETLTNDSASYSSMSYCASCSYPLPIHCGKIWRKTDSLHCCFHCKDGNGHSVRCPLRESASRDAGLVPIVALSRPSVPAASGGATESVSQLLQSPTLPDSAHLVLRLRGEEAVARIRVGVRPPFSGWDFHFVVASRSDIALVSQERASDFFRVDCRNFCDIHLLQWSRCHGKHDGRHPNIQALFFQSPDWDAGEMRLWEHLSKFLMTWLEGGEKCKAALTKWWLFCTAGRHRSLGCAMAYARVLAWLGGSVSVSVCNSSRLCTCSRCTSMEAQSDVVIAGCVSALVARLARMIDRNNLDALDRVENIVEFEDYSIPRQAGDIYSTTT